MPNIRICRTVVKKHKCHRGKIVAVRIRDTSKWGSESIELSTQIHTVVRICRTVAKISCVWNVTDHDTENARIQSSVLPNRTWTSTSIRNLWCDHIDLWKSFRNPEHELIFTYALKTKTRSNWRAHRKNEKTTRAQFAGASLRGVKMKILEKYGF